jgi:hypothetical protein
MIIKQTCLALELWLSSILIPSSERQPSSLDHFPLRTKARPQGWSATPPRLALRKPPYADASTWRLTRMGYAAYGVLIAPSLAAWNGQRRPHPRRAESSAYRQYTPPPPSPPRFAILVPDESAPWNSERERPSADADSPHKRKRTSRTSLWLPFPLFFCTPDGVSQAPKGWLEGTSMQLGLVSDVAARGMGYQVLAAACLGQSASLR